MQKLLGATSCIVRARTTHTSELLDAASKHIAGHMHTITLDQTLGLLDRYDTCAPWQPALVLAQVSSLEGDHF